MNTAGHGQPKKRIPWLKLDSIMRSLLPKQGDILETNLPFLQTEKGSPRRESKRMGEEGTPRNQSRPVRANKCDRLMGSASSVTRWDILLESATPMTPLHAITARGRGTLLTIVLTIKGLKAQNTEGWHPLRCSPNLR